MTFVIKLLTLTMLIMNQVTVTRAQATTNYGNLCRDALVTTSTGTQAQATDGIFAYECDKTDGYSNCAILEADTSTSTEAWLTVDLGVPMDISTIIFYADNEHGEHAGGKRGYGLHPDHNSEATTWITQSGETNFASMIADIGEAGTVKVRYIHMRTDIAASEIKIYEILCYEKRRINSSEA